jgi:hypothetical protein
VAAALGVALTLAPSVRAGAEPAGRPVRIVAEAVTLIGGLQPRFVIDAKITPGGSAFNSEVHGWLAALPPGSGSDTLEGSCVEAQCAVTAALSSGKMALSADLAGDGPPGMGRLILSDDDGRKIGESAMKLTVITGPVPGLGELAPVDAVSALELSDILMWSGSPTDFSHVEEGPVGWLQRQALAEWQAEQHHHANGLILKDELAQLRTAGYPAALLPKAQVVNRREKRFTSLDGRAVLMVAVQPPMSPKAFDTFVAQQTADRPGVTNRSYTRVNNDMEITYQAGGKVVSAAFHNRPAGFARLEFSRPVDEAQTYAAFDTILPRSLRVTDALAPIP